MRRRTIALTFLLMTATCAPQLFALQDAPTLKDVQERIESIELERSLDRDFERAEKQLLALLEDLSGLQVEARKAIVVALGQHHLKAGDPEAAARVMHPDFAVAALDLTPDQRQQWLDAVDGLKITERWVTPKNGDEQEGEKRPETDVLRESVREFVRKGQVNQLRDLGGRVVPILEELIAESELGTTAVDPAEVLIPIAPARAGAFLLSQLDQNGPLFRLRVIDAARSASVFDQPYAWTSADPPVCLIPSWLNLLERLLEPEDALSSPALQGLVHAVIERDALTPAMQKSLIRTLHGAQADLAGQVIALIDVGYPMPSTKPVYEALLASERSSWRRLAAEKLVDHEDPDSLLSLAQDEDAQLRSAVAESLRRRAVKNPRWEGPDAELFDPRQASHTRVLDPEPDERELSVLTRLAEDPVGAVRVEAARALVDSAERVDPQVFFDLLEDPSERVRRTLAELDLDDAEVQSKVAHALSRDPSSDVVESFVRTHGDLPPDRKDWASIYLEPVLYASFSPSSAMSRSNPAAWNAGVMMSPLDQRATRTPEATKIIIELAVRHGGDEIIEHVFLGQYRHFASFYSAALQSIDAPTLADFLRRTRHGWSAIAEHTGEAGQEAFRSILRDADSSADLRLTAARYLEPHPTQEDLGVVLELLPAGSQASLASSGVSRITTSLPPDLRNRFILQVMKLSLPVETTVQAAGAFTPGPQEREVIETILDRWLERRPDEAKGAVLNAISRAAVLVEARRDEVLRQAIRDPSLAYKAIETYVRLGLESAIPMIGDALRENRASGEAINALRTFKSDAAVAELLESLQEEDDKRTADQIRSALDDIWAYRQERQRWTQIEVQPPTNESALGELISLLEEEDETLRIEAIRGLGALGAQEAIPRLIPFLRSEDEAVREAARKALDRLYE